MKPSTKIIALAAALLLAVSFASGCGAKPGEPDSSAADPVPAPPANFQPTAAPAPPVASTEKAENFTGKPRVEITMADGGVILVELEPEVAPITVSNFLELVEQGFYDGLIFHRVVPEFMIQGGCPDGTGMGGPGHEIKGEFSANGVENPISHVRGVISMARSQSYDSAGSQFFITVADSTFLDGQYAAFGTVLSGMEVADAIVNMERSGERPVQDAVIQSIRLLEEE